MAGLGEVCIPTGDFAKVQPQALAVASGDAAFPIGRRELNLRATASTVLPAHGRILPPKSEEGATGVTLR